MDLLKSGQKLNIYFEKDGNLVEIACVISSVLDDRLVIDLPQYFMRYIEYLDVGCQLTAKVFSKLGTIDFNTVVISSPLEEEFSVELDYNAMKLTPNNEIPVVNAMETLNMQIGDGVEKFRTFVLSTEFVKFYSDRTFQVGEAYDCEIVFPKSYGTISFRGTISEVDPVYDNEYTAVYSNMTEEDRQNLLYYMYLYSNNFD